MKSSYLPTSFVLKNIFISIFLFAPVLVFAKDFGLQNPISVDSIADLILIVTRVIRYIALPFVIIMIMYSGFQYIWGAYQGKEPSEAHDTLWYTIIGAFVLLSAELIAFVIRNTINTLSN